jgi:inosine/xanthosine triphosphatase
VTGPAHALARVRRVRVGTTNGPKIAAATEAIRAYVPGARVEGAPVESGVSDQPVGLDEIARGARNRAAAAFELGDCQLAVGYEDGLVALPELGGCASELLNLGCAAVTDGVRTSLGLSSGFSYPPECARQAATEREPIGDLFDALWSERRGDAAAGPSGQGIGNIGKLSLGVLPRTEYARHAILCALVPLLHPDLYDSRTVHPDGAVGHPKGAAGPPARSGA